VVVVVGMVVMVIMGSSGLRRCSGLVLAMVGALITAGAGTGGGSRVEGWGEEKEEEEGGQGKQRE